MPQFSQSAPIIFSTSMHSEFVILISFVRENNNLQLGPRDDIDNMTKLIYSYKTEPKSWQIYFYFYQYLSLKHSRYGFVITLNCNNLF